jgi:hypothetical protein
MIDSEHFPRPGRTLRRSLYNVALRLTRDCEKPACRVGERVLQPPARSLLLPEMGRNPHRCGHPGSIRKVISNCE